jgi:hypothetical protein
VEEGLGAPEQARVENTCFKYKSIIGDRPCARHPKSQEAETQIVCNILNRILASDPTVEILPRG